MDQQLKDAVQKLQKTLQKFLTFLHLLPQNHNNSERLYRYAYARLGTQRTSNPNNIDQAFACVDHLEEIYFETFGEYIGSRRLASTVDLQQALLISSKFRKIKDSIPGCIIISPTQGNQHGHVGIMGVKRETSEIQRIMSNNSNNGKWTDEFMLGTWKVYYEDNLGLKTYFYERI